MNDLKIPGLQRFGLRQCVHCGTEAESYCARCGVTPYCSASCQRRDWHDRHRAVCHNLARLSGAVPEVNNPGDNGTAMPPPVQLRRPHSPANTRRDQPQRDDDSGSDKQTKRFLPTDHKPHAKSYNRPNIGGRENISRNNDVRRPPLRHETTAAENNEDWGTASTKPRTSTSQPAKDQTSTKKFPRSSVSRLNKLTSPKSQVVVPKPVAQQPEAPKKEIAPRKTNTAESVNEAVKTPTAQAMNAIKSSNLKEADAVKTRIPKVNSPASVEDVTPTRKIIPKSYLISQLTIGDSVVLSIDNKSSECRTSKPGYICLSMHEKFEADFQKLCEDYVVDCESDTSEYSLTPGDTFSYLNREDGGWYRARCLNPYSAALLDSSKVITLKPDDKCKKLPPKYENIPEFCCVLQAKEVEVGANLRCTLLSKTSDGYKVSMEDVESGTAFGEGEVSRWVPDVEYPVPVTVSAPQSQPQTIPEVSRPPIVHSSRVLLVDATAPDRVFVRPADSDSQKRFDSVLQDVLLYGTTATPLKETPVQGQTVIGKFTDGHHYRALCKRTNVKQNKYLLEYIEYGNVEISSLERLYPCPPELDISSVPTQVSLVKLGVKAGALTPPAEQYLEPLKEHEMLLTLPGGAKIAPSGSVATLTVVKTNEAINKKIEELCTPEWKKIEERGGDVTETVCLMYSDLECMELPSSGCTVLVLDDSVLEGGSVSGCPLGLPHAEYVFTHLAERMAQYCNSELGRKPYLPMTEELCIAQFPPHEQWFRAVFLEQLGGPGGAEARLLYIDHGNVGVVPVALLRKMVPEFVKGLPAVSCHMEIRDFPDEPSAEMLAKARRFMKINDEGQGELRVKRCVKQDEGMYLVDAPELIQAMNAP